MNKIFFNKISIVIVIVLVNSIVLYLDYIKKAYRHFQKNKY